MLCDKNDEIVFLPTALMVGIANEMDRLQKQQSKRSEDLLNIENACRLSVAMTTVLQLDDILYRLMQYVETHFDSQLAAKLRVPTDEELGVGRSSSVRSTFNRDAAKFDCAQLPTDLVYELSHFGINLRTAQEPYQLLLELAAIMSSCTEHLCSRPKAGILRLGDVCNLCRPVVAEDL